MPETPPARVKAVGRGHQGWSAAGLPQIDSAIAAHHSAQKAEIERLAKELRLAKSDLEYQTEARCQDSRDNIANFRTWKKQHHEPLIGQLENAKRSVREQDQELEQHSTDRVRQREQVREKDAEIERLKLERDTAQGQCDAWISNAETLREQLCITREALTRQYCVCNERQCVRCAALASLGEK